MDELFKKYEGIGISHRGICDEMKRIVDTLSFRLPLCDEYVNNTLISMFSIYKFIKEIKINGNNCFAKYLRDDYIYKLEFSSLYYGDDYKHVLYNYQDLINEGYSKEDAKKLEGKYIHSGMCHLTVLEYLKEHRSSNVCAVTSLCVNFNNYLFFHSYLWDKNTNKIIDIARNIIMDKQQYDFLYTYQEINVLSYNEYMSYINNTDYKPIKGAYCQLLYLALLTLSNEKKLK